MSIFKKIFGGGKPQELQTDVPKTALASRPNYPKEVMEIHNEFDTAGEKMLCEANEILSKASSTETEKGKRLLGIGFRQAKQAQEVGEIIKQAEISKEIAQLIGQYKIKFPNHKFITELQVEAICKKYNLVCGDVSRFKGFVPEPKLMDIENFTKKYPCNTYTSSKGASFDLSEWEIATEDGGKYYHFFKKGRTRGSYKERLFQSDNGIVFYGNPSDCSLGFSDNNEFHVGIKKSELQICAPIKDMDMGGGVTIVGGYKIQHIPDPVVLFPVDKGYIIITAWGDEASDELVVNQVNN